jgi:hypothetical protein
LLLASLALASAAPKKPGSVLVVGSGNPASDVVRLQNAIDRGGTIVLRGTFVLGDDDSIVATRGVELVGEPRPDGKPGATIVGGQPPLYFDAAASLIVRGIRFEDAIGRAIDVRRTTGALIERCEIVKVRPAYDWDGYPIPSSVVIEVQGWTLDGGTEPSRLTGEIVVRDNFVEPNPDPGRSPLYDTDFGAGIDYFSGLASIEVSGNTFRNINSAGIHLFDCSGRVSVFENVVDMGPVQIADGWLGLGNGIGTGSFGYLADLGEILVAGNEVSAPNPMADGILVFDFRPEPHAAVTAVVAGNRIVLASECCGALTGYYGVKGASYAGNRVEGSMVWAAGLVPSDAWDTFGASGNSFVGNDLSAASAAFDVAFFEGADHNTYVGTCRGWWDEGADNLIIDRSGSAAAVSGAMAMTPARRPFTDAMRAAIADKLEHARSSHQGGSGHSTR